MNPVEGWVKFITEWVWSCPVIIIWLFDDLVSTEFCKSIVPTTIIVASSSLFNAFINSFLFPTINSPAFVLEIDNKIILYKKNIYNFFFYDNNIDYSILDIYPFSKVLYKFLWYTNKYNDKI